VVRRHCCRCLYASDSSSECGPHSASCVAGAVIIRRVCNLLSDWLQCGASCRERQPQRTCQWRPHRICHPWRATWACCEHYPTCRVSKLLAPGLSLRRPSCATAHILAVAAPDVACWTQGCYRICYFARISWPIAARPTELHLCSRARDGRSDGQHYCTTPWGARHTLWEKAAAAATAENAIDFVNDEPPAGGLNCIPCSRYTRVCSDV